MTDEEKRLYNAAYYALHAEELREKRQARWRILRTDPERRAVHNEQSREGMRRWRVRHPEEAQARSSASSRAYWARHRDEINAQRRAQRAAKHAAAREQKAS